MEPSDAVGWQKVHTQFKEYESEEGEGRIKEQSLGFSFKSGGVVRQYPAVLCLVFSPRSHGGLSQEILTSSFSPWSRDRRPASPFFLVSLSRNAGSVFRLSVPMTTLFWAYSHRQ
jgi:hypothetical protein